MTDWHPKTWWAYLAGLIDGDGCIQIVRRDRRASIGDRKRGLSFGVVIKIGGETGHVTALRADLPVGYLYVRKREGQRHLCEWILAGEDAKRMLERIQPYLRLKRDQAQLALSMPQCRSRWNATPEIRARQKACWTEMKHLNHRYGRGSEAHTWQSKHVDSADTASKTASI